MMPDRLLQPVTTACLCLFATISHAHGDHDLSGHYLWLEEGLSHLFTHADHLLPLIAIATAMVVGGVLRLIQKRRQSRSADLGHDRIR